MKKITLLFILFTTFSYAQIGKKKPVSFGKEISLNETSGSGLQRCSTDEYEKILRTQDPKRLSLKEREAQIAPLLEKYKNLRSETGGIINIPVVVHVIHNGDAYGVDENITDEQVLSQITVMNQDFRRMTGTPGYNDNAIGADVQIQFVMAKADPNGNPTNGIDRVNLCTANYTGADSDATIANVEAIKPQTIWDPTLYMNMWSVKWNGSGLLGYAQFPSISTSAATAQTDGVVSGHTYFGSRTIYPGGNYGTGEQYDKGRTMTHEVGHFLGLYHTFQEGCDGDGDECNDTPAVAEPNYSCPTGTDSCPNVGIDMIENYMDYTDDSCMNIFTLDQKVRIDAFMTYPRRATLKTSTKDQAIILFENDAQVIIENDCSASTIATCTNPNPIIPLKMISLYNRGTSNLTSASINYTMNGGANYTYNFSGNLTPNEFVYITLPNTNIGGTLNTTIINTNGVTDQRTSNNVSSKTFVSGTSTLADVPYTTFTFNLIGDPYGSEIEWNLKNQDGATLYSGGPYTDLDDAGTQILVNNLVWNLPAQGCYTFTIDDSYGDGLSGSTEGGVFNNDAGSWSIKANSGTVVIGTGGGNFGTSQGKSFTNASTNTDFSIYPNPTRDILNVAIPSKLGSNITYEIFNYLGQIVKSNKATTSNFTVNTSDFPNGIYIIKLNIEGTTKTLKFIKE